MKYGFIDETSIFDDGSHIKANNNKYRKKVVEKSVSYYEEELEKEIIKDRKHMEKSH